MHRFIDEVQGVPSIKVVVFTGGECFMFGKDLDEMVKHANDNGYSTRFVSNGYWATSRQNARRRLQKLVDCGLKEANFSTGEQHARFIPPEYVRNGAMAAAELGLTSLVAVDSFGDANFNFDDFISEPDFQKHVDAGTVVLKVSPWMRFNGKRRIAYTEKYLQQMQQHRSMGVGCATLLKVLACTPSYIMYACCGLTMEYTPELQLGSLKEHSIPELLRLAPDDFMKIWVHLHGPDAVLRYAQKLDSTIPTPRQQAHTCDVCRYIYSNPRIRQLVMQKPPDNMQAIVAEYVQSLFMPTGELNSKLSAQMLRAGGDVRKLKAVHKGTRFEEDNSPVLREQGGCQTSGGGCGCGSGSGGGLCGSPGVPSAEEDELHTQAA